MSELKVYHHELRHNEYEEFYLKYEADKVIDELRRKGDEEMTKQEFKICEAVAIGLSHYYMGPKDKREVTSIWRKK